MKIINKTYLLIAILIVAAAANLLLLYEVQQIGAAESFSILRAGDLKVKSEIVASLATSIASGNEGDRDNLKQETEEFESILNILLVGGAIRGQSIVTIPNAISGDYENVASSWDAYKNTAEQVQQTSVFDEKAVNALNYVLEKNGEMILLTDSLGDDLSELDRDYNRHKEIAVELQELAQSIGQNALLISIGEGEGVQDELKKDRLSFDIEIRNLLQIPTDHLDLESVGKNTESLIEIPRENSESLRKLDPLWESVQLRVTILEERTLLAPEFEIARNNLQMEKSVLLSSIDNMLDSWNEQLNVDRDQQQNIIQMLLVVDIIIFFVVLFVIRRSLNPLGLITAGLSRVKEGVYGEKIDYQSTDEVGELVNTFNIMSDTIKQKDDETKKISLAKDEFLAMITHELKTPLVPIQGYSDILLSEHLGKLTDEQKDRIQIIKSSSASLLDIISDLLDAQKLDLGQLRMKKESHSTKDTIEKAIQALKPKIDEKQISINTSGPEIIVIHDEKRIGQVLTNLMKNSLKAVEEKTGSIEIITEDLPEEVKISVKDNGIGIAPEKQEGLFKKFFQVDTSLTRERGGSGLGLTICKGIIDGHDGEITIDSALNAGATFSFTIPKNPSKL